MKAALLKHKNVLEKVSFWITEVLEEALCNKDIVLQVQSYVALEMCTPFRQEKIPFEEILREKSSEDFIKTAPLLFIDFLILINKYQPDLYSNELQDFVNNYELILEDIYQDSPDNINVCFLLHKIKILKETECTGKKSIQLKVSEDDFLLQPKKTIDEKLNDILRASSFGQYHFEFNNTAIEAIETVMLIAAKNYDLILATKALKVLLFTSVENSYAMEYVFNFLVNNQSIEGYIGHYEVEFAKTNTKRIAQSQQLQITKEILEVIIMYSGNCRIGNGELSF